MFLPAETAGPLETNGTGLSEYNWQYLNLEKLLQNNDVVTDLIQGTNPFSKKRFYVYGSAF